MRLKACWPARRNKQKYQPERRGVMSIKQGLSLAVTLLALIAIALVLVGGARAQEGSKKIKAFDDQISDNAEQMMEEGRDTFRNDTFGDEEFWGDLLRLHTAISGAQLGGVGPGVSPKTALRVGLNGD